MPTKTEMARNLLWAVFLLSCLLAACDADVDERRTGNKNSHKTKSQESSSNSHSTITTDNFLHVDVTASPDSNNPSASFAALIKIFSALIFVACLSTVYDIHSRHVNKKSRNQLFLSFSVYTNGSNLIKTTQSKTPTEISCLHGIRVLSIINIIFLHSFFYRILTPNRDEVVFKEFLGTKLASSISAANISVDSFFVISATLVTRSMLREFETGRFNYLKLLFQRYLRLTPTIVVIIIFSQSLGLYLSHGAPSGYLEYLVKPCEKFWWAAVLHTQVYTNPKEMCMHTLWYVSVEWQMTTIFAPILIYLLWKFGRKVLTLIAALSLISSLYATKVAYGYKFLAREFDMTPHIYGPFHSEVYYPTHIRGTSYLIGIVLGYVLHTRDKKTQIKTRYQIILWIYAFLSITGAVFITIIYDIIGDDVVLNALLIGFVRILWSLSVGWVVFACYTGIGGFVNDFLSWKYWIPLGRIGFSLYLVHPVLMYNMNSSREQQMNLDLGQMLLRFSGEFILSIFIAIFLFLLVEEPLSLAAKAISKDWSASRRLNDANVAKALKNE